MSSSGEPRLKRFGGKGAFGAWKLRALAYLQTQGLKETVTTEGYVFGKKPALSLSLSGSSGSTDEEKKKAEQLLSAASMKKGEKAYSLLLSLLEDNVIDLVSHIEPGDAFGVWKILIDTYEGKSTAKMCHLLDLLMNLRFKPKKEEFDSYRARMTTILMKLKEMNETVSPALQRYVLLKGLPKEFDSLVQTLKVNDAMSFEETCTHIKDTCESKKLKTKSSTSGNDSESSSDDSDSSSDDGGHINTLAKQKTKRKPGGPTKTGARPCFTCGKSGHVTVDCPIRKSFFCNKCKKKGHLYKECKKVDSEENEEEEIEVLNG